MNHLSVRSGPQYDFILQEHQQHFEQRVIDAYMRTIKEEDEYELPRAGDFFLYVLMNRPEHFVAAYLGRKHKDPEYFLNLTQSMSERDKYNLVLNTFNEYNTHIEPMYDDLLYYDMKSVLDFHHISYIDISDPFGSVTFGKDKYHYYKNLPIVQVW